MALLFNPGPSICEGESKAVLGSFSPEATAPDYFTLTVIIIQLSWYSNRQGRLALASHEGAPTAFQMVIGQWVLIARAREQNGRHIL
jgi:hypothetical protein